MSKETTTVKILGSSYKIACPPEESEEVKKAAVFLDNKLTEVNRITKRLIMMFVDSVLIVFGLLSSFSISLHIEPNHWYWPKEELFWIIYGAPVIAIPIFFIFTIPNN